MQATDASGQIHNYLAINEVSLLRQSSQSAKIRILVDGNERLPELSCDGIMVATSAGSTAYNLSAHGPILPIGSQLLALTPVSPFRPRRWRGALLRNDARVPCRFGNCWQYWSTRYWGRRNSRGSIKKPYRSVWSRPRTRRTHIKRAIHCLTIDYMSISTRILNPALRIVC